MPLTGVDMGTRPKWAVSLQVGSNTPQVTKFVEYRDAITAYVAKCEVYEARQWHIVDKGAPDKERRQHRSYSASRRRGVAHIPTRYGPAGEIISTTLPATNGLQKANHAAGHYTTIALFPIGKGTGIAKAGK